jgi:hypothetical protein
MKILCGILLLAAGAAGAQTIDFTAVTSNGAQLSGEVSGSTLTVSSGTQSWSQTLTQANAYGQVGALNPGGYVFATGNMCLDFSQAASAADISPGVLPTSLNPANYFSQFTYTKYGPTGSVAGGITAMVTSVSIAAGAAITAVSGPVMSAPEIDPSGAASGLALLAGLVLVARGRRENLTVNCPTWDKP